MPQKLPDLVGVLNGSEKGANEIDEASISLALEGSLRRLQTDYIDLYQIHWPDRYVPNFGEWSYDPKKERETVSILEQMEALSKQVLIDIIRCAFTVIFDYWANLFELNTNELHTSR